MFTQPYTINDLPELPLEVFELSAKLEHARTSPILIARPHKRQIPAPEVSPVPTIIPKSEFYVRKYLTQATYPQVICYPPSELANDVVFKPADKSIERDRDIDKLAQAVHYFKLSSFNGTVLQEPYMCTVHYGPWSAIVIEEQSCIDGVPNRFLLSVSGIPGLELEWYGTWDDIPTYPSLHVIKGDLYLLGESFFCCPGYVWCPTTQSCIPQTIECKKPWQP